MTLYFDDAPKNVDERLSCLQTIEDVEMAARAFARDHFTTPGPSFDEPATEYEVLATARGLMAHLFDYVEFRYEDPERIFRMWRILIPFFLGTGNKNYAAEATQLFINLEARRSAFDAYTTAP